MKWIYKVNARFAPRELSQTRTVLAIAVAAIADLLQLVLFPLTWAFAQQAVDVVAMLLTVTLLGFHLLLLPTFVLEFIPAVNVLPTWTGCVVAVIALRKRAARAGDANRSPPAPPTLDV